MQDVKAEGGGRKAAELIYPSSSPAKAGDPVATEAAVFTGCPAFAGHDAQGESEMWNIQISDKVTAPVIRQTIKRGHGNM
jgi:hypothetical protein